MFIKPHTNITITNPEYENLSKIELIERWKAKQGQDIICNLLKNRFDRRSLIDNIGRLNRKYDLRGIQLYDNNFSRLNLSGIDFTYSDLSDCKFIFTNFNNTILSNCDIQNSNFRCASFHKSIFDKVKFNTRTNFREADLKCADLTKAKLLQLMMIFLKI